MPPRSGLVSSQVSARLDWMDADSQIMDAVMIEHAGEVCLGKATLPSSEDGYSISFEDYANGLVAELEQRANAGTSVMARVPAKGVKAAAQPLTAGYGQRLGA